MDVFAIPSSCRKSLVSFSLSVINLYRNKSNLYRNKTNRTTLVLVHIDGERPQLPVAKFDPLGPYPPNPLRSRIGIFRHAALGVLCALPGVRRLHCPGAFDECVPAAAAARASARSSHAAACACARPLPWTAGILPPPLPDTCHKQGRTPAARARGHRASAHLVELDCRCPVREADPPRVGRCSRFTACCRIGHSNCSRAPWDTRLTVASVPGSARRARAPLSIRAGGLRLHGARAHRAPRQRRQVSRPLVTLLLCANPVPCGSGGACARLAAQS